MVRCFNRGCRRIIANTAFAVESVVLEDDEIKVVYFCSEICRNRYLSKQAYIRNLGLDKLKEEDERYF